MRSSSEARALRAAAIEHDWRSPLGEAVRLARSSDPNWLTELAAFHGVVPMLYLSLKGAEGVHPNLLAILSRTYAHSVSTHMRTLADLARFAEVMDSAGIPWLTFKGPALAETVYPRADLRSYSDLDLLVPRRAFEETVHLLESNELRLLDQNWRLIRDEVRGQLHIVLPAGTVADLHWHLVNRAAVREAFSISTDDLFARAQVVRLGGTEARTLSPVDRMLHLCVHAGLDGGVRLLSLKDIEYASRGLSWTDVLERARSWHASRLVALMLQRARRVLGVEVPGSLLGALAPEARRRLNDWVDQSWPVEGASDMRSPGARWARFTRDSLRQSVRAARARAKAAQRSRAERADGTSPVLLPSGDERERREFFGELNDPEP